MIGYLKGRVLDSQSGNLLLGVGDASSIVGYALTVPHSSDYENLLPGEPVEFFVYTHLREDALELYGFLSAEEKRVFLTLISVNGVGPKLGLGLLSAASWSDLLNWILEGEKERLVKLPGVGKKTAERMILELREPLQKKIQQGWISVSKKASSEDSLSFSEARAALSELGYKDSQIHSVLEKIKKEEISSVEAVIKRALQEMGV